MDETLKRISRNTLKNNTQNKKDYYEVGKAMSRGQKFRIHNEQKMSARRTYKYYSEKYGDWEGPTPRKLAKMNKESFERLFEERKETPFAQAFDEISELILNLAGEDLLRCNPPGTEENHVDRTCDTEYSDLSPSGQGYGHELEVTNLQGLCSDTATITQ